MIIEQIFIPSICESNAMNAAAHRFTTRIIMADFYADCIRCTAKHGVECIDWKKLNAAIVRRWPGGLEYIKKKAWKMLEKPCV